MKKIISILMVALLIVSDLFVLSYAQDEVSVLIHSDENILASVGEVKKVPVYISNNTGIMGFKITLAYDANALNPISIERGDIIRNGMLNDNIEVTSENEFYVVWSDNSNVSSDGVLFYVNFQILQTTATNTDIEISFSQDDTFNEDWEDVTLECKGFSISISGQSSSVNVPSYEQPTEGKPIIYSDFTACEIGETSIPVCIKNNSGIMGYKLSINYDSKIIEPKEVICSSDMNGSFDSNIGLKSGTFSVVWNSTENSTKNGLLFELVLNIKSTEETIISISYLEDDTFDEDWEAVDLVCKNIVLNHRNITSQSVTIDYVNRIIYGFDPGLTSIRNQITANDNVSFSLQKDGQYIGTGSKVLIYNESDSIIEEFSIIIFGDTNGDGWCDGMDAIIVSCIANGLLTREQIDQSVWISADCNHDGAINEVDVETLNQAGLHLTQISQTAPKQ